MRVRFLHLTASAAPEYPFRAGQIIEVHELSPQMRAWLREARIEILPDEELATMGAPVEVAVVKRAKSRGAR